MLTLEQALALLERMEAAAPPSTAVKLAEIAQLLQSLSNDNEYLVGLYGEALILPVAAQAEGEALRQTGALNEPEQRRGDVQMAEMDMLYVQMDELLRQPLQRVQSASDTLAEYLMGTVDPEVEQRIQQISVNASVAARVLDGVRQILAIKSGLVEATPLVFSVAPMLREAARQVQERARQREQQFDVVYPDDSLQARGDYQQILVILLDLLDNAIAYTPVSGTIQLSAEDLGTVILFTVQDSGIGLSADEMEQVGQPFWRATGQPLVSDYPGAGLNLYLAREILQLQNGELIFSGEPDLGSTFSFTLPAAR